jgi:prepilin-type N-terminal cleavage/methylation domain-containing protein
MGHANAHNAIRLPIRGQAVRSALLECDDSSPLFAVSARSAAYRRTPRKAAMNRRTPKGWPSRSAFTLIEMLIVVSIMMILVAAGATAMRPANDSRRVREAARAINVYLSSARNHAMETGRPCGVMLRRFQGTPSAVMNLDQCEVPAPYCGDTETATMSVQRSASTITHGSYLCDYTATFGADFTVSLVHVGDLIQFNQQGPFYTIAGPSTANDGKTGDAITSPNTLDLAEDTSIGRLFPWTTSTTVTYRILRAPTKGAAAPLQLPASSVIDLDASGIDNTGVIFGDGVWTNTVMILFDPTGAVNCVYARGTRYSVTNSIFLLVGKRERTLNTTYAATNDEQTMTNYQDLNNLWVVLNPQTGLINTEPVASSSAAGTALAAIDASRALARQGQGMGGK